MNRQMQPRKKATTKKYIICEAPQVAEEELLDALIARHKGKVQFIDFWATWCGGCRQIIKEYEPLKKDISEDKVAFIYLTGPSSIKKTWEILIEDIAGEHYWLDTFSNDRVTDVSANRQAREYSETIYSHYRQRIKRFTGTRNQ